MPRFRRVIQPGDLIHVISRFVDEEFRLNCPEERQELLRRLGESVEESDWQCVSYGLMSNHYHSAYIVGFDVFEKVIKRVHCPFANWLNSRQGRRGPLFAGRPDTIVVDPIWTGRLVAYQHNNPPRAGVVTVASESDWTSHRSYIDPLQRPNWLSAGLALGIMGFSDDIEGRSSFDAYVLQRQWEPRDIRLTGNIRRENRELREQLEASVELQHPRSGPEGLDYASRTFAGRWKGGLEPVIELVAITVGSSPVMFTSPRRDRAVCAGRRQVALIGGVLGLPNRVIGLHLGVSETAVRKMRRLATEEEKARALQLARTLLNR